jgi:DNA-binding NtrC family response regulator
MPNLLIADDQPDVLEALRLLLKGEGFRLVTAASPDEILEAVEQEDFDAVLMDLNYARDTTSGREGLDVLSKLRALDHTLPVIVMTAWGSVDGAVEAMRLGARDYIEKPWDNARLLSMLRTQIELAKTVRENQNLEGENRRLRRQNLPEFVASSRAMQPVVRVMERVGPSDANVLVTGDHGTGKEVVARWLHAASRRSERSLIAVNAGGFSETLFESELFGHVKGAFTDAKTDRVGCFELADGGTLFLDEIANITPKQQAKLLRVLESGEVQRVGSSKTRQVDVRVVSATNADLDKAIAEGQFREDLLYRLNTVEIRLPPLRDRREDIPVLAARFLERHAEHYGKELTGFDKPAMQALLDHAWPGNVRELEHVVERAVLMARGTQVEEGDLNLRMPAETLDRLDKMTLDDAERVLIRKALDRYEGNVSRAADALGLSRSALYRRLEKHDL